VFRIRIDLNTDPDPAFEVNTDPDPGFFMSKMKRKEKFSKILFLFFSLQLLKKTLIEDSWAPVKKFRPSAKW